MLPVGIGLCYGKVILGDIGQYSRLDYTLIGSTVNLASRFCTLAGKSETAISKNLLEKVSPETFEMIEGNPGYNEFTTKVKATDPDIRGVKIVI